LTFEDDDDDNEQPTNAPDEPSWKIRMTTTTKQNSSYEPETKRKHETEEVSSEAANKGANSDKTDAMIHATCRTDRKNQFSDGQGSKL
jgi:hypothetical protein